MNQADINLPSHFGKPGMFQTGFKRNKADGGPISITESYFNNTREALTVVKRSGLVIPLPSEPVMGFDEKMGIRIEFRIRNVTVAAMKRQLSLISDEDGETLKMFRAAIENSDMRPMVGGVSICLEYPLTLTELKKYGGTVYYGELDLVVSLQSPDTVIPHPHSERGRRASIATMMTKDMDPKAFGYSILTVDNFGQYGPRFLNISGKIYRVDPVQDFSQQDGVYVTCPKPVDGDLFIEGKEVEHHSFENAVDSLGLYKTHEEALTFGDLGTARKAELAKMEQDNLILQRDLNHTKSKLTAEQAESDRQMKEMEATHAREKLEAAQKTMKLEASVKAAELMAEQRRTEMKDLYEQRSLVRKDNSEIIKVIPAIVLGVGAIGAVLFKLFSK